MITRLIIIGLACSCTLTAGAQGSTDSVLMRNIQLKTADEGLDSLVFTKTEIAPAVNKNDWTKHFQKHLPSYASRAAADGMRPGLYPVTVRFIVERDGSVSDVRLTADDPGFGLGKAAVTLVRTGPKWYPAEQNGRKVRCYHSTTIQFRIGE